MAVMTKPQANWATGWAGRGAVLALVAGGLVLAAVVPASAQDAEVRALNDRVQQLERDLRTLERATYRGEKPPAPSSDAFSSSSAA